VIDREKFYTENSNKPHNPGIIDPRNFSPCPKNPAIARCGSDPELVEGDIFRFILPLIPEAAGQATGQVIGQVAGQVTPQIIEKVLRFCEEPRKGSEIQSFLGLKHRETFQDNYLKPLLNQKLIALTIPDKLRSPAQQYMTTEKGKNWLKKNK